MYMLMIVKGRDLAIVQYFEGKAIKAGVSKGMDFK